MFTWNTNSNLPWRGRSPGCKFLTISFYCRLSVTVMNSVGLLYFLHLHITSLYFYCIKGMKDPGIIIILSVFGLEGKQVSSASSCSCSTQSEVCAHCACTNLNLSSSIRTQISTRNFCYNFLALVTNVKMIALRTTLPAPLSYRNNCNVNKG